MPSYPFESDSGDVVHRFYPMSRAPEPGTRIAHKGRVYRRVLSLPNRAPEFKPYVSRVPPKRDPRFRYHDAKGHCIVETRAQERNYAKQEGLEWT